MYLINTHQFRAQLALFAAITSFHQALFQAVVQHGSGIDQRRTGRKKPNLKKRKKKS
jgi:hypothetical protein